MSRNNLDYREWWCTLVWRTVRIYISPFVSDPYKNCNIFSRTLSSVDNISYFHQVYQLYEKLLILVHMKVDPKLTSREKKNNIRIRMKVEKGEMRKKVFVSREKKKKGNGSLREKFLLWLTCITGFKLDEILILLLYQTWWRMIDKGMPRIVRRKWIRKNELWHSQNSLFQWCNI